MGKVGVTNVRRIINKMKKITVTFLILVMAVCIAGCGKTYVEKTVSAEDAQPVETVAESNGGESEVTASVADVPDSLTEHVQVPSSDEEKREIDGDPNEPVEITNAKKIWRTYELRDNESTIPRYLYLEVFLDSSNVEIYHQYYAENTYSLIPWPISDGVIEVKEFSADGGAPATWDMYIEYGDRVIKLYEIDDNDGSVLDSYYEFVFSQEDILE